jgi:hypothetical protein
LTVLLHATDLLDVAMRVAMESNRLSTILLRIAVDDETVMSELDEVRLVESLDDRVDLLIEPSQ